MRREAWCITTLSKDISAHTVWLIMRKRWHIENNGFRMLKTYFHADHNYVHGKGANEKILLFILMAFNLMELFLFRRLKNFRERRMLRIDILATLFDELYIHNMAAYFKEYDTG
jgi:IS4 transposase